MISYTMPCHKRQEDLSIALQSLFVARAKSQSDIEIVVVDYGNPLPLVLPPNIRRVVSEGRYFHMAHARNVGIKAARGSVICSMVCDQIVEPNFFNVISGLLQSGTFLSWQETFVFWHSDIEAVGGFDERFELYGPEGKELAERLERCGLHKIQIPKDLVSQLPTSYKDKISNYAQSLSRREMHHIGMDTWKECGGQPVANVGKEWGSTLGPTYRTYSPDYIAQIRERIQMKIREHERAMAILNG